MRCPKCGRVSPDNVRFCSYCATPLGGYFGPDISMASPMPSANKDNTMLIVGVVVVVVIVVIAGAFLTFAAFRDAMCSGYLEVTIENHRFVAVHFNLYMDGELEDSDYVSSMTTLTATYEAHWVKGDETTHLELTYGDDSQTNVVTLREDGVVKTTFLIW